MGGWMKILGGYYKKIKDIKGFASPKDSGSLEFYIYIKPRAHNNRMSTYMYYFDCQVI